MTNNNRIGYWVGDDGEVSRPDPSNLYRYVGNSPTNFVDLSGLAQRKPEPLDVMPRLIATSTYSRAWYMAKKAEDVIETVRLKLTIEFRSINQEKSSVRLRYEFTVSENTWVPIASVYSHYFLSELDNSIKGDPKNLAREVKVQLEGKLNPPYAHGNTFSTWVDLGEVSLKKDAAHKGELGVFLEDYAGKPKDQVAKNAVQLINWSFVVKDGAITPQTLTLAETGVGRKIDKDWKKPENVLRIINSSIYPQKDWKTPFRIRTKTELQTIIDGDY